MPHNLSKERLFKAMNVYLLLALSVGSLWAITIAIFLRISLGESSFFATGFGFAIFVLGHLFQTLFVVLPIYFLKILVQKQL